MEVIDGKTGFLVNSVQERAEKVLRTHDHFLGVNDHCPRTHVHCPRTFVHCPHLPHHPDEVELMGWVRANMCGSIFSPRAA